MEAGRVTLPPGAVGELHSTQHYEEVLVVLLGTGELRLSGRAPLPIAAPGAVYVPPHTEHVVANTSTGSLVYVYVAAPTR
jgi:mannose-6-phosphate isomerase-like protein (cupin superfamily)